MLFYSVLVWVRASLETALLTFEQHVRGCTTRDGELVEQCHADIGNPMLLVTGQK